MLSEARRVAALGRCEVTGKGHERSFWGTGEVPFLDLGADGYVHFVKIHPTLRICVLPCINTTCW